MSHLTASHVCPHTCLDGPFFVQGHAGPPAWFLLWLGNLLTSARLGNLLYGWSRDSQGRKELFLRLVEEHQLFLGLIFCDQPLPVFTLDALKVASDGSSHLLHEPSDILA